MKVGTHMHSERGRHTIVNGRVEWRCWNCNNLIMRYSPDTHGDQEHRCPRCKCMNWLYNGEPLSREGYDRIKERTE